MRFAVVGAGGVGGYFGGRLACKANGVNHEVWFIVRPGSSQHDALRRNGLTVRSTLPHGDFVVRPCRVASSPSEVGPCDVILVCTKAKDLDNLELKPLLKVDTADATIVMPLLNGIDAPQQLA
mmetsp:Transcript_48081/g.79644  ORF Transcript_48081/g.79644 Transcript_48081/m.79644 type:complete len:123 (-) Transcript_48081:21-389(-)